MAGRGIIRHEGRRGARDVDTQRLHEAIKGPGIDTRTWIETGICQGDAYSESQDGGGVLWFCDVVLQPSGGDPVTCRLGSWARSGSGVGVLSPLHDGDEVQVMLDDGDPNNGPVAVARLNGPQALPPAGWNNDSTVIVSDVPIRLVGSDVSAGAPTDSSNPAANNQPADKALLGSAFATANGKMLGGVDDLAIALAVFAAAAMVSSTDPILAAAATALNTALSTAGWNATGLGDPIAVFKQAVILSNSFRVGK